MTPFSPLVEAIGEIGEDLIPKRIDGVEAQAFRTRAKAALAEEFGDVGLAVMKDPRMCQLMPFWGPALEEAKWSVRALLPIRSPLEVAWSLNCRDGLGPA